MNLFRRALLVVAAAAALLLPGGTASAQCTAPSFAAGQLCGNPTGSPGPGRPASPLLVLDAANATGTTGHKLPYLDGLNTWSGLNAFGSGVVTGTTRNPSGTTYSMVSADCGGVISSGAATGSMTVTLMSNGTVPAGCEVGLLRTTNKDLIVNANATQVIAMPTNGTDPSVSGDVTTLTINQDRQMLVLKYDGANWRPVGTPNPVVPYNPYSGELSQQLISTGGHTLLWADENPSLTNWTDVIWSSATTASVQGIPITGSASATGALQITFFFSGAGLTNCSAGCTVSYTPVSGDNTLPKIAIGMANAIAADPRIVSVAVPGKPMGGGLPGPMLQVPLDAAGSQGVNNNLFYLWRADVPVRITAATTGGATATFAPTADCATSCILEFEGGPTVSYFRTCGLLGCVPAPNSNLWSMVVWAADSSCPTGACRVYATISTLINSSATATPGGSIQVLGTGGNLAGTSYGPQGLCIGPGGLYYCGNSLVLADKGPGSIDMLRFALSSTATSNNPYRAQLTLDGSDNTFLDAFAGKKIILSPATSVNIATFAAAGVVLNNSSGDLATSAGTNSQLLVGQTGVVPTWNTPSGDWTISTSAVATLATVNSNVGACGSATAIPTVTLNGKGLATACTTTAPGLSPLSNALGAPVTMTTAGTYYTGPTVAQGTTGTWLATGKAQIVVVGTNDQVVCRLWDGTTVISSGQAQGGPTLYISMALSGYLASPAGNIRIDCANLSSNNGTYASTNGVDAKASIVSVIRVQ